MTRHFLQSAIVAGALSLPFGACAQNGETETDASEIDATAVVERVRTLEERRRTLEAESDSRAEDPVYHFDLANVYADLARREQAVAAYEKAVELDPGYVEALVNLASLKTELGRADQAIELLERAAAQRPGESKVWVNLGNAYYSRSDYALAMDQYRKALQVDPRSHEAHYQFAVAFADVGIYREAIREWEKVVELAPDTDAARSAIENIDVVRQILERKL